MIIEREFRDAISPEEAKVLGLRPGTVTAIDGSVNKLTATVGGVSVANIRYLDQYSPRVGDRVWLLMRENTGLAVGSIATNNESVWGMHGASFQNSWGNWSVHDGNWRDFRFRRIGDTVKFEGLLDPPGGAGPQTILTMPAGFRPAKHAMWITAAGGVTLCRLDVDHSTYAFSCITTVGAGAWISMWGFEYTADGG